METREIPYDMRWEFDERLREVPVSEEEMRQGLSYLKEQLAGGYGAEDTVKRAKALGLMGVYSRILGEYEESERSLLEAVDLYRELGHKRGVAANQIRLATTLQWKEDFTGAEKLLTDVIRSCQEDGELLDYLDFACQHRGKCRLDQGDYAGALVWFEQALSLRESKGNQELLSSTRQAVQFAKEKLRGI